MIISDVHCQHKNLLRQNQSEGAPAVASSMLIMNDDIYELNNGMLFARPLHADSIIVCTVAGCEKKCTLEKEKIRQPVIFFTLDKMELCITGPWSVEVISMPQVTTLFSFLDFQAKHRNDCNNKINGSNDPAVIFHTERSLVLILESENKTLMWMLIETMLKPQACQLDSLFSFVRNMESYWISIFLLSQVMNEDKECDAHKIYNASKIYGVSESYFRKLCYLAFTRGPKKQLRIWRAAHSALQLIEKDNSIATIAGNNGYASSSHFSSEIKSLFGITPREFKKLEGFFHE